MADIGLPAQFIANCSAVGSLTLTFTKILTGASYDRFGLRCTLLLCQIAAVLSFLLKWALTNSTAGMVMALVSSSLSMLALPLETVMLPLLTNDLFGSASYTRVLGVFMAMNSIGLCLGSPLGDLYFDIFGTYKPCFWFFAAVMAAVIVGYQFVLRAAKKEKAAVLAQIQEG
jgi:MFS family permease